MVFNKEFLAALFVLVQVSQATPDDTVPGPNEPYLGKPCDGSIKIRCNFDQELGPENSFKVKCENNVWVKDEVCKSDEICAFFPAFKRALCIS
jgi:hypothetical protein